MKASQAHLPARQIGMQHNQQSEIGNSAKMNFLPLNLYCSKENRQRLVGNKFATTKECDEGRPGWENWVLPHNLRCYLHSSPIDKTYQHMTIRDGTASAYHSQACRQAGRQGSQVLRHSSLHQWFCIIPGLWSFFTVAILEEPASHPAEVPVYCWGWAMHAGCTEHEKADDDDDVAE